MEAVGLLAGGIAHDLNSLLGVISGYGYMLNKRLVTRPSEREYLQEMLKASRRAKELILRLNDFSRPVIEHKQPVRLHTLIQDSIQLFVRPSQYR